MPAAKIARTPRPTAREGASPPLAGLAARPLSTVQVCLGWRCGPLDRVARLCRLRRDALAAELDDRWARADFLWGEVDRAVLALAKDDAAWAAAGAAEGADGAEVRRRFLAEVWVDTYVGLYNGRLGKADEVPAGDRAFAHLDRLERACGAAGLPDAEAYSLLAPATRTRVAALRKAGRWDEAFAAAERLAQRFPGRYPLVVEAAGVASDAAYAKLVKGENYAYANARELEKAIERLERLEKKNRGYLPIYERLGELSAILAVQYANSDRLSQAIVAAKQAQAYHPGLQGLEGLVENLAKSMEELQKQMREVQEKLRKSYNSQLNYKGQMLLNEAKAGFGPAAAWAKSADGVAAARAADDAKVRHVWLILGLPVPEGKELVRKHERVENGPSPEGEGLVPRSMQLVAALGKVIDAPPPGADGVARAWSAVAAADPELAGLDPDAVERFLVRRIFGPGDETAPGVRPPADPPVLTAATGRQRRSGQPFAFWLLSRRDLGSKVLALSAAVALLAAGVVTLREERALAAREKAYGLAMAARARADHATVLDQVERFLAERPIAKDRRVGQIEDAYDEALVRWFVAGEAAGEAEAGARLARYRELTSRPDHDGGD